MYLQILEKKIYFIQFIHKHDIQVCKLYITHHVIEKISQCIIS